MNIAIIDLGTNTFNLLIAELTDASYKSLHATKDFVQLGKGGINKQQITDEAFKRGLKSLTRFKKIAQNYSCTHVLAIATSAIRNAENGQYFCQQVYDATGITIEIIDGNREADLIYLGAKQAVSMQQGTHLIMDVGGGSTEFIICNHQQVFWKQSFEVGVARLFERFHHSDPISSEEISNIITYLHTVLTPLLEKVKEYNIEKLIGCSGAFSSFAAIILNQQDSEDEIDGVKNYEFDFNEFKATHKLLLETSLNERLKIVGLLTQRAPMIVVGSILVNFILENITIKKFEMSKFALKEGAIFDFINKVTM